MRANLRVFGWMLLLATLLLCGTDLLAQQDTAFAPIKTFPEWHFRAKEIVRLDAKPEFAPTDWAGEVRTYGIEGDVSGRERGTFIVWSEEIGRLLTQTYPNAIPVASAASAAAKDKLVYLVLLPSKSTLKAAEHVAIEDDGRTDHPTTAVTITGVAEPEDLWKEIGKQIQVIAVNDIKPAGQGVKFFIVKVDRALIGHPLYWVNDFGEFLIHLDRIDPTPDAKYNRALYLLQKKDTKTAYKLLTDLLKTDPNNPALLKGTGDYFVEAGQPDSAVVYYEKVLEQQYEFIDCWNALVKLRPRYYMNLGVLYLEKGKKLERDDLLLKAKENFDAYLAKVPGGELTNEVRTRSAEVDDFRHRITADSKQEARKADDERRNEDARTVRKQEEASWRSDHRYLLGAGLLLYSGITSTSKFKVSGSSKSVTKEIDLKVLTKSSFQEFGLSAAMTKDRWIFRGNVAWGSVNVGPYRYTTTIDTAHIVADSTQDSLGHWNYGYRDSVINYPGFINSISAINADLEANYNVFYFNPVLLNVGVRANFGYFSIEDEDNNFTGIPIFNLGAGASVMFKISKVLFEVQYQFVPVGTLSGSAINAYLYFNP